MGLIFVFQTRLRELREATGYRSQQSFADAFGVAQSTIGNWEAGKREPNYETTMRLARFFGVSIDDLLGLETKKEPAPVSEGGLTAEQADLINLFDAASPELRAAALAVLKSAEEQDKPQGDASEAE